MRRPTEKQVVNKVLEERDILILARDIFVSRFSNPCFEPNTRHTKAVEAMAKNSIEAARTFYKEWRDANT